MQSMYDNQWPLRSGGKREGRVEWPVGTFDKSTQGESLGTRGQYIEFGLWNDREESEEQVKEHKLWERCCD